MGRLDHPDKQVDWVSVSKEYLAELYEKIASLKRELDARKLSA